uniref:Saposin B-type domain-containing protein n=2 Tax=Rhabditophanes sp. KR3021 TaxID=114890 RepID=A0AC35U929_9BILA
MTKFIILLALTILAVGNIYASIDCDICHQIISAAEAHFKNGEPESTLLGDLVSQCKIIGSTYGQQATSICLKVVQQNIDKIYGHFNAGMKPCAICLAAGSCLSSDTCTDSFLKF